MHVAVNLVCKCRAVFRRAANAQRSPDNNDNGSGIAVACIALHVMKTAIALRIITMLFHYMRNNLRKFANARSNWGLSRRYINEPEIIARHCSLLLLRAGERFVTARLCKNVLLFLISTAREREPGGAIFPIAPRSDFPLFARARISGRLDAGSQLILIIVNKVPGRCNVTRGRTRAPVKN